MWRIPPVPRSQDILDLAFSRAKRLRIDPQGGRDRKRVFTQRKADTAAATIQKELQRIEKAFPSIGNLHPFFNNLIDCTVGTDDLKHSLGALSWAKNKVRKAHGDAIRGMKRKKDEDYASILTSFYGRVSSIVNQVDRDLVFLAGARERFKSIPGVDPSLPTVVIAGYPNVGKSQLVGALSRASPKVASYPFTTTSIHIGHMEHRRVKIQVVDTPGLLDRGSDRLNPAEVQAVTALRHLADMIIFLFDPTGECGYTPESQKELMERIAGEFPQVPMLDVDNKADLGLPKGDRSQISALSGEGVEELRSLIMERLDKTDKWKELSRFCVAE